MASLVILVSAVLVLSCEQTDTQTDADERFTPVTLVDVCNEQKYSGHTPNDGRRTITYIVKIGAFKRVRHFPYRKGILVHLLRKLSTLRSKLVIQKALNNDAAVKTA